MQLEQFDECLADCDAAIDCDSTYLKAFVRRASVLERLEKLDEALADYDAVLEADPRMGVAVTGAARLRRAIAERDEKLKEEMMGKLKGLGNTLLGKFGLSLDNFKVNQTEPGGGYSINFVQGGEEAGKGSGEA
jgi:hypothetical protein